MFGRLSLSFIGVKSFWSLVGMGEAHRKGQRGGKWECKEANTAKLEMKSYITPGMGELRTLKSIPRQKAVSSMHK